MAKTHPLPTQEELKEYFNYKDGYLISIKRLGNNQKLGHKAHYDHEQIKYHKIHFRTLSYKAHRLIWVWHYGNIPDNIQIDHIDRNKKNNRIENLRLVTALENRQNMGVRKDNTSGKKGVYWDKNANKWASAISYNGKKHYLGIFSKLEDAIRIREEYEKIYHPYRPSL